LAPKNKIRVSFLILIILGLIIPTAVFASEIGTIITISHKYEQITYRVNTGDRFLVINQDGVQDSVSFEDVRFIYNKDGRDITREVLWGVFAKPDSQAAPIETIQTPKDTGVSKDTTVNFDIITIETVSSKIKNITYFADTINRVLEIDKDGWKSKIDFDEIVAIYDKVGRNITPLILAGGRSEIQQIPKLSAAPPSEPAKILTKHKESWLSENSEVIQHARKRFWKIGVSGCPIYSVPVEGYEKLAKGGIGYEGVLHIELNHEIASGWRFPELV